MSRLADSPTRGGHGREDSESFTIPGSVTGGRTGGSVSFLAITPEIQKAAGHRLPGPGQPRAMEVLDACRQELQAVNECGLLGG